MPKILREPRPRLERDIQAEIRLALGLAPDLVMWRNAQVFADIIDANGPRKARGGLGPGSSDLVGVLAPGGRFVGLEVKMPGEKPTEKQATWLGLIRRFGGFACVVSSADEARAALERARNGASE